jgi:hypothetical protein
MQKKAMNCDNTLFPSSNKKLYPKTILRGNPERFSELVIPDTGKVCKSSEISCQQSEAYQTWWYSTRNFSFTNLQSKMQNHWHLHCNLLFSFIHVLFKLVEVASSVSCFKLQRGCYSTVAHAVSYN